MGEAIGVSMCVWRMGELSWILSQSLLATRGGSAG